MSTDKEKIIDIFCKKFLVVEKTPNSFSEILNMNPSVLKECKNEYGEKLKKYKITQIRDFVKLKSEKIKKIAKETSISEELFEKWILTAELLSRAWKKRSLYLKKSKQKIIVLGLNNAGKTSMLESLKGKTKFGDITNLPPTKGVDIQKIEVENFNLTIWDFGGQEFHRQDYLKNPEEFFLHIDLIIYVIDIQDSERFDESIEYFDKILDIVSYFKENPYVLVLLHKSDPDIRQEVDFQINLEMISEIISTSLNEKKFSFELIQSSIYNFYANEPEFAKSFKQFFGPDKIAKNLEEQVSILSEMVIKLNSSIMNQFQELKGIIGGSNLGKIPSTKNIEVKSSNKQIVQPPPPPPKKKVQQKVKPNRNDVMSELRKVFKLRNLTE
ncbi:ADP-ribosylation factor-like protein [Promethearchaeum syntrophicum]|uniref:ADP-ribosylation factor-like protein n=1 Tax=Promethearchaeum syntrophicum TaxID=2594042 RepID=A0A5B9DCX8_9ARCH|nr:ADP-ribosylation factor-like protein [Candidatus Prometheoarchaeum syntrophicum]QEE16620.1 hypothetical protein DSAG12_02450 [Candidatus Prometheoarchaeum syntrophicum]